ncbi:hypothetical protein LTR36_005456 [Oleoguttula mirabilis]|uniref:LYC1 C-terminal domain-containing protein n=1 Tax=Oleoguttula mirabilis TaxID=1507867 RepID=A0AAV9JEU8_9PEZI|nr:hypothetical protein LTR36_005456 [Oleoguttula mirabilis]
MTSTSTLPPKDSPDLHLVVATPEENLAQTNANSTEWRGALSLDAYLRREELLMQQDLAKDGGLTAWMLVYQPPGGSGSDGQSQRRVLCGCESFRKKALLAKAGRVEDVVAHGIASVFCPPAHRGRGYAGRMMSELGVRLKTWQVGQGGGEDDGQSSSSTNAFSVLYSDIGKQFYTARGWQPFPSAHIALPAATATPTKLAPSLPVTIIDGTRDITELCAIDARLLRQRLARSTAASASASASGRTAVALLPDRATLDWHHAREAFVATELHGDGDGGEAPAFLRSGGRGALVHVGGPEGSRRVWCYWTRVWTNPSEEAPDTLHILRIVVEDADEDEDNAADPDSTATDFTPASGEGVAQLQDSPVVQAIAVLLSAAQTEAERSGMAEVQVWNPTSITLAAAQLLDKASSAVVQREEESIASLLWYGEGSWRDVEWVCNEKYGWC